MTSLDPTSDETDPQKEPSTTGSETYVVPNTVRILESAGNFSGQQRCTYYLVGTAHVSRESCREVRELIAAVHPDIVFLELCQERKGQLAERKAESQQEAIKLHEAFTAYHKGAMSLFEALYVWALAKLGGAVQALPGSEFREAVLEAKKVGAHVVLGDRPVHITLARTWDALPLWHRLTFLASLLGLGFCASSDMLAEIENMKDGDVRTQAFMELAKAYPSLLRPLVEERDEYMVHKLRGLPDRYSVTKVVAVVGLGHLAGMEASWDKDIDIEELEQMPDKPTPLVTWRRVGLVSLCGVACVSLAVGLKSYGRSSTFRISRLP